MPNLIHQETLMCCNYKRCPVVKMFDDGSMEISDDDAQNGSFGTIKLAPEVADRLFELVAQRKRKSE